LGVSLFRRRRELPGDELPADEVADVMARLAEAFIRGSAAEGLDYDYTPAAARRLDEHVDLFLQSAPREEVVHSMIMAMGAYLGEVVVRAGAARWGYDEKRRWAVLEQAPDWRYSACPMNRVAGRIHRGHEKPITPFLDACLLGGPREEFRHPPSGDPWTE
jgi:hypothetical protein